MPRRKFVLRQLSLSALRLALRVRSDELPTDFGGPVLIVAPHPDDETFGCGGLIHRLRNCGHPVHLVYLTSGGASHSGHPSLDHEKLVALREVEARLAAARLGMQPAALHFLGMPDGRLRQLTISETDAALDQLRSLFSTLRPAAFFLPWRHDGSTEHEAAFLFLKQLDGLARLFEFPVWAAWSPRLLLRAVVTGHHIYRFRADSGDMAAKQNAIKAYVSQTEPTPPWTKAVLPHGFASAFLRQEEFFLETTRL